MRAARLFLFSLVVMICAGLAALAIHPVVLIAQDSLRQAADTSVHVVLPTGCSSIGSCVGGFVLANQIAILIGLQSLLMLLLSRIPSFADLGDWGKRLVQFASGAVLSFVVMKLGGKPDPAVTALVTSVLATVIGGFTFNTGKIQPASAAEARTAALRRAQ